MPKMKLDTAYRFNGQVYGPSYGETIDVPDEVAWAAGYETAVPPSDPAHAGTPAEQDEATATTSAKRK